MFLTDDSWPVLTLSAAGMQVRLSCSSRSLAAALERRWRPFLTPQASPNPAMALWVQVEEGQAGPGLPQARVEFSYRAVCWDAPACQGRIDLGDRVGFLTLRSARPLEDIDYFLRLAYALLADEAGGFLFHAAGIVRSGKAYLFFGASGSGKTTVARLSSSDLILNDDLLILLSCGSTWEAHATPFWNPSQVRPNPSSAPLAGLYRLVQDRKVSLEPLRGGLALAETLSCVPVLPQDPARSPALMDRCRRLLATVPAFRLHFLPDDSFWALVAP